MVSPKYLKGYYRNFPYRISYFLYMYVYNVMNCYSNLPDDFYILFISDDNNKAVVNSKQN